jgi:hypothetical protein
MRPREDGGQTEAEVGGHEEGGDDGGPVMRLGEPVQLAQTTAENEPRRHAAGERAHQEQPQRPGEERGLERGQAGERQRQPTVRLRRLGILADTAWLTAAVTRMRERGKRQRADAQVSPPAPSGARCGR